ncbi:MAG: hypothetical protein A2Y65_11485 [Deltaproteobacteria bacterium RBG_13_52_11]|nr:MAG: hypothetical protein A2Y65_11485 [Deltaproteobacteria bacterium RBG_13_52_11]
MSKTTESKAKHSWLKQAFVPILAALVGGLVGGPLLLDALRATREARIWLDVPKSRQELSVPYDFVVQFRNRPKDKFICAFLRGSGERLYYPLIPDNRITDKNGEWKYTVKTMGTQADNGVPYELVFCLANDSAYIKIEDVYFGKTANDFWCLPQGVEEEKRITIFRKGP